MQMKTTQIFDKANKLYPQGTPAEKNAYVRGYIDGLNEQLNEGNDFYEKVASGLRELWPQGNKSEKWPWRDSVKNLKARLEYVWKNWHFKGKYTVDDCLMAARRYLANYEQNTTYMQTLKYFVFKQDKIVSKDGKVTYTYKSTLADYLDSNPSISHEFDDTLFESTVSEGDLI